MRLQAYHTHPFSPRPHEPNSDVSLTYAKGDTLEAVDPYGNCFAVHRSLPYFPGRAGVAYLQLPCLPGTAVGIAHFYAVGGWV